MARRGVVVTERLANQTREAATRAAWAIARRVDEVLSRDVPLFAQPSTVALKSATRARSCSTRRRGARATKLSFPRLAVALTILAVQAGDLLSGERARPRRRSPP